MTKREKRRHAALVKTAWTKEWLAALDDRDFAIVSGVTQASLQPRSKLTDEQLRQARLVERERQRRQQVCAVALTG